MSTKRQKLIDTLRTMKVEHENYNKTFRGVLQRGNRHGDCNHKLNVKEIKTEHALKDIMLSQKQISNDTITKDHLSCQSTFLTICWHHLVFRNMLIIIVFRFVILVSFGQ
jgi:hypothetical protein